MGWISERSMRRGGSLYSRGPKRKGPLREVVGVLSGDYATNLFGSNRVLLECGHISDSYGGKRAICEKCREGKPADTENIYGVDVAKTIERWRANKD